MKLLHLPKFVIQQKRENRGLCMATDAHTFDKTKQHPRPQEPGQEQHQTHDKEPPVLKIYQVQIMLSNLGSAKKS